MQFITRKQCPTSFPLGDMIEFTQIYTINGPQQIYQIEVTGNDLIILKEKSLLKNRDHFSQQIIVYQLGLKAMRSTVITSKQNINKFWLLGRTEIAFFINLTSKVKFYIFSLKTNSIKNVLTFKRQRTDRNRDSIDTKQRGGQIKYFVFSSIRCICLVYPQTNTSSTIKIYSIETEKYQQPILIFKKDVEVEIKKIRVMQQSSTIYYANINEDLLSHITLFKVASDHVVQNYYQFNIQKCLDRARMRGLQISSIEQVNQKELYLHVNSTLYNFRPFASFLLVANKRTHQIRFLQQKQPDITSCYIMMSHSSELSFVMNMVFDDQFEDESQMVYIDRSTGQVIKKWFFDQSRYILSNFSTSQHALSLILTDNQYENQNWCSYKQEHKRKLIVKHFYTPKLQYLHWLLHLNEDFDDDLLQEAVQLLESDSQVKPLLIYQYKLDHL